MDDTQDTMDQTQDTATRSRPWSGILDPATIINPSVSTGCG